MALFIAAIAYLAALVAPIVIALMVVSKTAQFWDARYKGRAIAAKAGVGEILVSLAGLVVVGGMIFLSLILAALSSAQSGSRDSQRKSDLNQYRTALEQYKADKGSYPVQAVPAPISLAGVSTGLVPTYLQETLDDPQEGKHYYYVSNGTSYGVCADLERENEYGGTHGWRASPAINGAGPEPASACTPGP